MTRKDRRELARKIAKQEQIIKKYKDDKDAVKAAQDRIDEIITSYLTIETTLEDMDYIDELVQKILS